MPTLYTAPSETITYALLVDDQRALVSQVYKLQAPISPKDAHTVLADMMALHTKQTQLLANNNYWLWPINQETNSFPSETNYHKS